MPALTSHRVPSPEAINPGPSQREIDTQISRAERARSDYLRYLMGGAFATIGKRFHHAGTARG